MISEFLKYTMKKFMIIFIEYGWLYSLSSSSSSAIERMSDLFLRVSCSISRYLYLNADHLRITIWDSRTSIQIRNTKIWSHSSEKRHSIFQFRSIHDFFFPVMNHSSVFIWKFTSVDERRSVISIRKNVRAHVWEIVHSKGDSIAKISKKRCMFIFFILTIFVYRTLSIHSKSCSSSFLSPDRRIKNRKISNGNHAKFQA